jgi:hypothetical protein
MQTHAGPSIQIYCARLVARQRTEVRATIGAAVKHAAGNLDLSGTGLRDLVEWQENHSDAAALRVILDDSLDDAVRILNTIDDHVEAIETLLRAELGHKVSAAAVLRGAMEATLMVCYLFDATVPPAQTLARHAAMKIGAAQGSEKALRQFGSEASVESKEEVREGTEGIKKFFVDHGFVLGTTKQPSDYTPSVTIDGETAQMNINTTEQMQRYMPDETYGWAIASGAVHSEAWFLPTLVHGIEDDALSSVDDAVTSTVSSLFEASHALMRTVAAHTGFDVGPVQKRTFTRLKALLAKARKTPFSPIDFESFQARGKSESASAAPAKLGASFVRPGVTYGSLQ